MAPTDSKLDTQKRDRLTRTASYASLTVALTLVFAKLWAWQATDAISILSSLADSFLDVLASAITFVAIGYALTPADREHRFGHGKTEGLAALAQAVLIGFSALYVWYEALRRLLAPEPVLQPINGLTVIIGSTLLTLALLSFQRLVVRRTGSVAIEADALHYRTDVIVNLSVAIAIPIASWTDWTIIDPLVGIGVAAYLMWSAYGIATKSMGVLLDREIPEAERRRIQEIALENPAVKGFHDLRTRSGGSRYIIQFHLELAPQTSLVDTHVILDAVENTIRKEFKGCELIVHADPVGFPEDRDRFE